MDSQDLNEKLHVILCGPLRRTERALLQRGDVEVIREKHNINLLVGLQNNLINCDMIIVEAPYGHGLYGLTYPVGKQKTCPVWMVADPPDEAIWKEIIYQLDEVPAKRKRARERAIAEGPPKNEILILADTPQMRSNLSDWMGEIFKMWGKELPTLNVPEDVKVYLRELRWPEAPPEAVVIAMTGVDSLRAAERVRQLYKMEGETTFTNGLPTNAGTYTVRASTVEGSNLTAASADMTLTINPLAITVTPDSGQKKEYGASDPTLTYKIEPKLIGTDELTGALAYEGEAVGTYPITQGTLAAPSGNYTLTVVFNVMFEITKPSLESAIVNLSDGPYTYDGTAKTPDVTVTKGGSLISADEYDITYSNTNGGNGNHTNAGTVTVTVTAKAVGNYSGSCSTTFVIGPAPLTIKAADQEITYGQSITQGTAQATAATLCGTDALENVTLTASTDNVPGGTIKPSAAVIKNGSSEDVTENYQITYQDGKLTITKATPTVTAPTAGAIEYGQKLSDSTLAGGDAVNPNGNAAVAGKWSWDNGSAQPTESGPFTATFTPTDTANYETPAGVDVSVAVNPAEPKITITAPAYQIAGGAVEVKYTVANPYDANLKEDLPAITLTYTVNGNTQTVGADGKFQIPDVAPDTVITITATASAVDGKYNTTTKTATVTVTDKAPVEITGVSVQNAVYDGKAHNGYTGTPVIKTLDGTTVTGVEVAYTWNTVNDEAPVNAGNYSLTIAVGGGDYIGSTTLEFTIAKATITIRATDKSAQVGSAQPELTYTVSGLASGEELATEPTLSCDPDMNTVGSYPITASGAVVPNAGNYETEITYVEGTLTVTAKPSTNPGNSGNSYVPPSTPSTSTLPVTTTGQNSSYQTTTTTATPTASTSGGRATTTVDTAIGNEIIKQAVANKSEDIVIAPKVTGNVTKAEVSIPASTVGQIRSQTNASLTIATPVADVTIPNGGLGSLSGTSGNVTVSAEKTGNAVELTLTVGGRTVTSVPGGLTLTVPVTNATPGTVAVLVNADGTREVVRKSLAVNGSLTIPLDGSTKLEIVDNSKYFTDVPSTSWAADAVAFASSHELFNGTGEGQFSPNRSMSRGMLAVVLYNLENNPEQALTGVFDDVNNGAWYAEGVAWAASNGIVGGYGNGQFGPNNNITREQLAVMLWRYAGCPAATDKELHFTDADKASDWALEALRWATEKGVVNGKGNGILDPTGQATRAETAQMLKNFMENK